MRRAVAPVGIQSTAEAIGFSPEVRAPKGDDEDDHRQRPRDRHRPHRQAVAQAVAAVGAQDDQRRRPAAAGAG